MSMTVSNKKQPDVHPIGKLEIPESKTEFLDNGIPVSIINLGDQSVNRVDIVVEGGRCDERHPLESDYVAALLREGSTEHSAKEIAEQLDFNGSWLGCNAGSHTITVTMYSLNRNFDKVAGILAELVHSPSFPEKELSTTKAMLKNRLRTDSEKVSYLANVSYNSHYYGAEHPLGRIPDENMIERITREDIIDFHRRRFVPGNMRFVVSGKIEPGIIETLNRHFGRIGKAGTLCASAGDKPLVAFHSGVFREEKERALQSAIRSGAPVPISRSHPDYIPLRILLSALGGYFGSRLMSNIREDKGYTYGISAALLCCRTDASIFISCQCDNRYVNSVLDEIKLEIRKLQDEPIGKDELDRLKAYMLSDQARIFDTPFSVADYYVSAIANGIPSGYFNRQVELLHTIDAPALQYMAQRYIDADRLLTVVAGKAVL